MTHAALQPASLSASANELLDRVAFTATGDGDGEEDEQKGARHREIASSLGMGLEQHSEVEQLECPLSVYISSTPPNLALHLISRLVTSAARRRLHPSSATVAHEHASKMRIHMQHGTTDWH